MSKVMRALHRRRQRLQGRGVVINFFRRQKDLQIANQVTDDETEQDESGDGHNGFLADGGLPEL